MSEQRGRPILWLVLLPCLALALLWLSRPASKGAAGTAGRAPVLVVDESMETGEAAPGNGRELFQPAEDTPAPAPTDEAPSTGGLEIHGVVEDLHGTRRALAPVLFEGLPRDADTSHGPKLETVVLCDTQGAFHMDLPPCEGGLTSTGRDFTTVVAPWVAWPADAKRVYRIVVAPTVVVSGIVTDEKDAAVEAATVQVRLPSRMYLEAGNTGRIGDMAVFVSADAQGQFEVPHCPLVAGVSLWAFAPGFQPSSCAAPTVEGARVHLKLRKLEDKDVLYGIVLDASGAPSSGASVSMGATVVATNAEGLFFMDPYDLAARNQSRTRPVEVVAIKGDRQSRPVTLPALDDGLTTAWPTPLVLKLDVPRLSIRGQVLDAEGRPARGVTVSMVDPTPFGFEPLFPGSDAFSPVMAEFMGGSAGLSVTNKDGRFWLTGLAARDYTLDALDERTLARGVAEGVMGGQQDVVILLAPTLRLLTGRVVDIQGTPIPDVTLSVTRVSATRGLLIGNSTSTSAEGAFVLGPVSDHDITLRVEGQAVMPVLVWKVPEGSMDEIEVVMPRRFSVEVDWSSVDPDGAHVCIYDRDGARIQPIVTNGSSITVNQFIPLSSRDLFALPETAASAAVVASDDAVLQSVPLRYLGEAVQVIRF